MGIKQVLSDVKNFVIAQEFNLKNYLGKAVIVIKDNPIPGYSDEKDLTTIA